MRFTFNKRFCAIIGISTRHTEESNMAMHLNRSAAKARTEKAGAAV